MVPVIERGDEQLARAVLRVGDGRGFVVEHRNYLGAVDRIVITAAHCLPRLLPPYEHLLKLPTPHPARYLDEGTYQALLGPLEGAQTVSAECLFVDPIADIAVLGQPDNQELSDEADAYDALVGGMTALAIADAPAMGVEVISEREVMGFKLDSFSVPAPGEAPARVLSLDGQWLEGQVWRRTTRLKFQPHKLFVGGMSGSPIINAAGAAIGVVSIEILNPVLIDSLPVWLARSIRRTRKRKTR